MAPLVHACQHRAELEPIVCLTGQHREMLRQVTAYFGIDAEVNLELMRPNQSLASLTARLLESLDEVVSRVSPECIVAQGDTTSVMTAALIAFYQHIPFVHVEAGLRTRNLQAPWPEELNRRMASMIGMLHCAPTQLAAENLYREQAPGLVQVTGNTVIDALLWTLKREQERGSQWQEKYAFLEDRPLVLITGHRRENFGMGIQGICQALAQLAQRFPDTAFLYPVHLNPNVRAPIFEALSGYQNVYLVEPASYPEFVWLMHRSYLILSDSGGVQEEAPTLKKPVLVMRETTERPEALEAGAIELVGTCPDVIVKRTSALLLDPKEYRRHQVDSNPYGDGRAAEYITDLIANCAWDSQPQAKPAAAPLRLLTNSPRY